MKPYEYRIYIEGGLHRTVETLAHARRLKKKFEAEGWNVKVLAWVDTMIGPMGIDATDLEGKLRRRCRCPDRSGSCDACLVLERL